MSAVVPQSAALALKAHAVRPLVQVQPAPQDGTEQGTIALGVFLDQVATVLRSGLPARLWIEATVVSVRVSTHGHSLELTDAAPALGTPATLRVFLSASSLAAIRRALGLAVDPLLLVGMTTALLIKPDFDLRWHLGGRVEGLSASVAASLRQKLLEQVVTRLKRDGVWDRQRRLAWPRDVTRLSVVHPANAAGWADIAGELRRWQAAGLIHLRSHPAPFEGEQAAAALVAALSQAVQPVAGHPPDLVLIVRGGGARASLAVLDEEAVARAVALCPVPVVAGTGHAIDRSLLDQLASRAVDTPSKALALVAGILRDAAQRAAADRAAVLAHVAAQLATHDQGLDATLQRLRAMLQHATARSEAGLAEVWARVRLGAAAAREGLQRRDGELQRLRADVHDHAHRVLDAQTRVLDEELRRGRDGAARHVARADDGGRLMAQVGASATAMLQRQVDALERHLEAMTRDAARHIDEAGTALEQRGVAVELNDLMSLLQRGLTAVTDGAGRLLPRLADARGRASLQLLFADGPLVVMPASETEQAWNGGLSELMPLQH